MTPKNLQLVRVSDDGSSFVGIDLAAMPNGGVHFDRNGDVKALPGTNAIPQGDYSHAEGQNTLATGIAAHAEGGGPDNAAGSSSGPALLDGTFSVTGTTEGFSVGASMNGTYAKGAPDGASGSNPVWNNGAGGVIYHNGMNWVIESGFGTPGMLTFYGNAPGSDPNVVPQDGWSCMGPVPVFTILAGSGSGAEGAGLGGLAEGDYAHSEGKETHALGMASHAAGVQSKAINAAERALAAGMFAERGDAQLIELVLKASAISGGFTLKTADGQDPKFPANCVVTGRMFIATADVINTYEEIDFKIGRDNMTVIWSPSTIGTASPSIISDGTYNTLVLQTTGMFDVGVRVVAVLRALIIKMP